MARASRLRWRASARLSRLAALVLLGFGGCVIETRPFDTDRVNCIEYCGEVTRKCLGDSAVYESESQCLAVCAEMPPGNADDPPASNTVLCRLERLHAGSFEEATDCPAAGPGGNGICGQNCEAFCALRRQTCAAAQPNDSDISAEFCENACPGLADPGGFRVTAHDNTDTLQCRLIHLSRALESSNDPLESCIQSQIVPENEDSRCTDGPELPPETDCRTYCHLVTTACTNDYAVYENEPQCMEACKTFERGAHGDTSLNTLRCRRYHAYAALDDPEVHCAHAGPSGDGHCGIDSEGEPANCVSYCRLLARACPDEYELRHESLGSEDLGACIATCEGLPDARANGFTVPPRYTASEQPPSGTLKCRTFHAVRALGAPNDGAECSAALGDPGSSCE